MPTALMIVLAFGAGGGLGLIYFGGGWWTRQLVNPARWESASLVLRLAIVPLGLYFVASGHWMRLVACLFGFTMSRTYIEWLSRSRPAVASVS